MDDKIFTGAEFLFGMFWYLVYGLSSASMKQIIVRRTYAPYNNITVNITV